MRYLLDTNCCIHLLKGTDPAWLQRFSSMDPDTFAVCTVVQAELEYGANRSQRVAENLRKFRQFLAPLRNLPFDEKAAVAYGEIRSTLERLGTPIGPNDLLIASIARVNGMTVLTRNTREFSRVPGLLVETW